MTIKARILDSLPISRAGRYEPESIRAFAHFLWRSLLIAGLCLAVLSCAYGVWVFSQVMSQLNAPVAEAKVNAQVLNRTELNAVLDALDRRNQQFETLKTQAPVVPDPSR